MGGSWLQGSKAEAADGKGSNFARRVYFGALAETASGVNPGSSVLALSSLRLLR